MLSCLMDAWVSLGHFPVLRLACQYLLALRDVTVWPSQPTLCAGAASWSALMDDGLRLPPLHCFLAPMTSGGSFAGPRPLSAQWQGGPWHTHVPTLRGPSSSISTAWPASWLFLFFLSRAP